jgi:hypothetical protein
MENEPKDEMQYIFNGVMRLFAVPVILLLFNLGPLIRAQMQISKKDAFTLLPVLALRACAVLCACATLQTRSFYSFRARISSQFYTPF